MLNASVLINLLRRPKKSIEVSKVQKVQKEKFKIKNGRITSNIMRFSVYQEMDFNEIQCKILNEQDGCFALNYLPDAEVFERCIKILEILKSKKDEESIKQFKFILEVLMKAQRILNNKL